jgi:DNA-binding GntR family transcriptional regulator
MEFIEQGLSEIYQRQVEHRTAADAIYWTLRDAIRKGLIEPGSRLVEDEISSALNISRTPVREALRRLQSEQLLEKAPSRGLVVPVLMIDDLFEIYEIEEVLFGLVARKAAQYMGPSELEMLGDYVISMEKAFAAGDLETVSETTAEFHNLIAYSCKNGRLRTVYSQLNAVPRLRLFEFAPERMGNALAEHRALYEAIAAHDIDQAQQLAQEHSRNALRAQVKAQKMNMTRNGFAS